MKEKISSFVTLALVKNLAISFLRSEVLEAVRAKRSETNFAITLATSFAVVQVLVRDSPMAIALELAAVVEPAEPVEPTTPVVAVVEEGIPEAVEPAVLTGVPLAESIADKLI